MNKIINYIEEQKRTIWKSTYDSFVKVLENLKSEFEKDLIVYKVIDGLNININVLGNHSMIIAGKYFDKLKTDLEGNNIKIQYKRQAANIISISVRGLNVRILFININNIYDKLYKFVYTGDRITQKNNLNIYFILAHLCHPRFYQDYYTYDLCEDVKYIKKFIKFKSAQQSRYEIMNIVTSYKKGILKTLIPRYYNSSIVFIGGYVMNKIWKLRTINNLDIIIVNQQEQFISYLRNQTGIKIGDQVTYEIEFSQSYIPIYKDDVLIFRLFNGYKMDFDYISLFNINIGRRSLCIKYIMVDAMINCDMKLFNNMIKYMKTINLSQEFFNETYIGNVFSLYKIYRLDRYKKRKRPYNINYTIKQGKESTLVKASYYKSNDKKYHSKTDALIYESIADLDKYSITTDDLGKTTIYELEAGMINKDFKEKDIDIGYYDMKDNLIRNKKYTNIYNELKKGKYNNIKFKKFSS